MGYAQCESHERSQRLGYLVAFVVLQVFLVPWASVADELGALLS